MKKLYGIPALSALFAFTFAVVAHAVAVPSLAISQPNAGSDAVQVTVFGAEPNVSVLLYHPSTDSYISTNIGSTNQSGYLLTTVNSGQTGIAANAPVYVMVSGQRSQILYWPNYSVSGSLPLSRNSVTVRPNENTTISASVSSSLSVSENTNPTVAGAYINGNQIIISGVNVGTTNIKVCATGIGCSTIIVTVQNSINSSDTVSINLSESSGVLSVGQGKSVSISGSGNYYMSSNSNPAVASASVSGSTLLVNSILPGTTQISVCTTGVNSSSCARFDVTVTGTAPSNTTTQVDNDSIIKFSPSSVNMTIGSRQSVQIIGSAPFSVYSNSDTHALTANVSDSMLDLTALAYGGVTVKVCQLMGGCGSLYVYVAPSASTPSSPTTVTASATQVPQILSFSVNSTDTNTFLSAGATVMVTFSTNSAVNDPKIVIGRNMIGATGSGSGPFTARYTLTSSDSTTALPIELQFTGTGGRQGSFTLTMQNPLGTSAGSSASTAAVGDAGVFSRNLSSGSIGADVTALQKLLSKLGFYSGPITGKFATLTGEAVKKYQKSRKIDAIGVVGPATRTALNNE